MIRWEIMSNHKRFRKMVAVHITTILLATFFLVVGNTLQSTDAGSGLPQPHVGLCSNTGTPGVARCHIVSSTQNQGVPMVTSGNDLYMAWSNNDTGHFNVFFAKSTDGGKTSAKNNNVKCSKQRTCGRPRYPDSCVWKQCLCYMVDQQDRNSDASIQSQ